MGISNPDTMVPSGLEANDALISPSFSPNQGQINGLLAGTFWDINTHCPRIPLATTTIFGLTVTLHFPFQFLPLEFAAPTWRSAAGPCASKDERPSD